MSRVPRVSLGFAVLAWSAAAVLGGDLVETKPALLDQLGDAVISSSGTSAAGENPSPTPLDVESLRQSAAQGDAAAQTRLGLLYHQGRGVEKDDVMAVHWARKAAEQGDVRGEVLLGAFYAGGVGLTRDDAQAAEWLHKAAEQGDPVGQFLYAQRFYFGWGTPQDFAQSLVWLRKSAGQGFPLAQGYLGSMYQSGTGVKKDLVQAYAWNQKGAEAGDARAQNNLGEIYHGGVAVDRDDGAALRWYNLAAAQGNRVAQYNAAHLLTEGDVGHDETRARTLFRQSAEQGYLHAQLELAALLETDRGGPPDLAAAARWYREAALQGEAAALGKYLSLLGALHPASFVWPALPFFLAAAQAEAAASGLTDPRASAAFIAKYLLALLPVDDVPASSAPAAVSPP